MASTTGKRPLARDAQDAEPEADPDAKRIRSNNGSPAPPPRATNGMSELERRKQEAAARMAAVKAKLAARGGQHGAPSAESPFPAPPAILGPPDGVAKHVEAKKAEAARKIAEMQEKIAAQRAGRRGSAAQLSPPTQPPPQQSESDRRRAEVRARAAQIAARSAQQQPPAPTPPPPRQDTGNGARGGLGIGLHPSLMGDLGASAAKSKGGKAAGQQSEQAHAPRINPYLAVGEDEEKVEQEEPFLPTLSAQRPGERKARQLHFNPKGKFMAQANALRQQAKLEEMKRRIAAETRKTEIEEASDKAFLVPVPPEVEWWDEGLVDKPLDAPDSIITALVQHPVILQAPQDKFQPAPKPLMLTSTEQKKLRRQRRMADMKEEQAKIRLGLVEPPPPKVKKSNMMRVLGEQAVKDPTAVEARVNKEIAQRALDHEKANKDRQLTKEQRAEKLKEQQAKDEAKGVKVAVFKVNNLSSGKHRYQVDVNAKQNALTGIVVLHPEMNLIIVEGGTHSINAYKRLMLNRIKWSENTLPLSNSSGPSTFTGANDGTSKGGGGQQENKAAQWLQPMHEDGTLKDLGDNGCVLVWEGDEQQRSFRKWGSRACETDGEARDVLSRNKMENMWTLARSIKVET